MEGTGNSSTRALEDQGSGVSRIQPRNFRRRDHFTGRAAHASQQSGDDTLQMKEVVGAARMMPVMACEIAGPQNSEPVALDRTPARIEPIHLADLENPDVPLLVVEIALRSPNQSRSQSSAQELGIFRHRVLNDDGAAVVAAKLDVLALTGKANIYALAVSEAEQNAPGSVFDCVDG